MDAFLWEKAREAGLEKKMQEALFIRALPLPYPLGTPAHEFYGSLNLDLVHYRIREDGSWECVTPPTEGSSKAE